MALRSVKTPGGGAQGRPGAGRRAAAAVGAVLTGLALTACTAPAPDEAVPAPTESAAPTATEGPIGPVDLPDDATAVVEWVDEVGPVEPRTVRLVGEPLHVTVSVVCDTADAEVTVEIDGLMTTGSSCVYDPDTTRTSSNGGGNTGSMQIAVDQDALVTVTTDPADAHWSGAISTGPLTVPAG